MEIKQKTTLSIIKRILSPIKDNPGMFFRAVLQPTIWALFDIYLVRIFKSIATDIQNGADLLKIKFYAIQLGVVVFFYCIWKWFSRHFGWVQMNYRQPMIIRKRYFPKYFVLEPTYVEKVWTWKAINILKEWVDSWSDILIWPIPNSMDILIKFLFACYLIFSIGPTYGFAFIAAFVVMHYFVIVCNKYAIKRRRLRKEEEANISRQLIRMIMSKQEILQNEKMNQEIKLLDKYSMEAHSYNVRVSDFLRAMFNIPLFLTYLLNILTLVYVYLSIRDGYFSLWLFSALIALAWFLNSSVLHSTGNFKDMTACFAHIEKLRSFIDNAPSMKQYDKWESFKFTKGDIKFENIDFSYDSAPIFKKFDLTIKGGKKTALVGVSWSGKSTIIKLIAGYIRADKGEIVVDGQKLWQVSLKSYYKHIGYLTQEPNVFDGTIYDNLTYALDHKPTSEQITAAIELSQCQYIYDFKDWLLTEIGEKWIRLSGGQRQRLAIAKIFLKNPEIVLLDEPTSALDSLSEEAITKAMHNLFEGRTVIIIAHRLQTVKNADDIIVLEQGKILERGTHKELVEQGGHYAKMLELQSWF